MVHRDRRRELLSLGAFFIASIASCVIVAVLPGSLLFRLVKIVPLLLLVSMRAEEPKDKLAKWVGYGLVASLVGDIAIDSVFVAGLGAFLVAHVFYLVGMGAPRRFLPNVWPALPALLYGAAMVWLLVVNGMAPPGLHAPITVYALVITMMLGRALGRAVVDPKDRASRIFCLGALLFVISDSLIATRRWLYPFPLASVWIMATYYAGQVLLYWGSRAPRGE